MQTSPLECSLTLRDFLNDQRYRHWESSDMRVLKTHRIMDGLPVLAVWSGKKQVCRRYEYGKLPKSMPYLKVGIACKI